MDESPQQLTIEQLDARQDDVLAQLDQLERQLEQLMLQLRASSNP